LLRLERAGEARRQTERADGLSRRLVAGEEQPGAAVVLGRDRHGVAARLDVDAPTDVERFGDRIVTVAHREPIAPEKVGEVGLPGGLRCRGDCLLCDRLHGALPEVRRCNACAPPRAPSCMRNHSGAHEPTFRGTPSPAPRFIDSAVPSEKVFAISATCEYGSRHTQSTVSMRYHCVVPLLGAAANILICILVLRQGIRDKLHRAFAWMGLAIVSWNLDIFALYYFTDREQA